MKDFEGKVAVVTGGASGIGRCMTELFAREGMKIVVADVEQDSLDAAVQALADAGHEAIGVVTDVRSFDAVNALADTAFEAFGNVHVLCNNAGIGTDETQTMIWDSPLNDWEWAFQVNVWGVIHGIKAFLPRMMASGEEGHVVNTSSSNGGLFPIPTTPIYAATKAAITTITEVLHAQLEMSGSSIKASVLYPGPHLVNTNIFSAARNRPDELPDTREGAGPPPSLADVKGMIEGMGMPFAVTEPEEVAQHALDGIREDRFWILPMDERTQERVRERFEGLLALRNPPLQFM